MPKTTSLNIHADTADRLRRLKIARAYSTGRTSSTSELLDDLIDELRKSNPALHALYLSLGQKN